MISGTANIYHTKHSVIRKSIHNYNNNSVKSRLSSQSQDNLIPEEIELTFETENICVGKLKSGCGWACWTDE